MVGCKHCSITLRPSEEEVRWEQDSSMSSPPKGNRVVCPYCRSVSIWREDDVLGITMCSQSSSTSSPLYHHHHHSILSCCAPNVSCESQLEFSTSSTSYPRHHHPDDHLTDLCRCAKNISLTRSSSSLSTTRTSLCSSNDGWRALRVLLLGILVLLPTTSSNPLNHHNQRGSHHSHRGNGPMKWINPCRIPASQTAAREIQMPTQTDEEIYQNIITQTRKAEQQATSFYEQFREECFGKDGHDLPRLHYDWLKDIAEKVNKNLNEKVSQTRLESLEVEDILQSMYRGLQKLAVGLEQVVLDQAFHGGSYYSNFHEAEFQLKYVLCEFQIAMMEKNIQYEDVTREIIDKDFVNLDDKTWRNLRDFSIFRDYLNTLEFIRESFEHFRLRALTTS